MTRIDDHSAGRGASWAQTFEYDALDRLTSADGPWGARCYAYDARGNRTTCGSDAYTYDIATDRLTNHSGVAFLYDANGNVTWEGSREFTRTPDNLIASTTFGGGTTSYRYDADGWRVLTVPPTGPSIYAVRGPNNQLLTEWDGTTARDFIYLGDQLIARVDGSTVRDVTTDAIGSVRLVR